MMTLGNLYRNPFSTYKLLRHLRAAERELSFPDKHSISVYRPTTIFGHLSMEDYAGGYMV